MARSGVPGRSGLQSYRYDYREMSLEEGLREPLLPSLERMYSAPIGTNASPIYHPLKKKKRTCLSVRVLVLCLVLGGLYYGLSALRHHYADPTLETHQENGAVIPEKGTRHPVPKIPLNPVEDTPMGETSTWSESGVLHAGDEDESDQQIFRDDLVPSILSGQVLPPKKPSGDDDKNRNKDDDDDNDKDKDKDGGKLIDRIKASLDELLEWIGTTFAEPFVWIKTTFDQSWTWAKVNGQDLWTTVKPYLGPTWSVGMYAVVGGAIGAVALPSAIALFPCVLGFGVEGIYAGSCAATCMACHGGYTPGGGFVATMQALGAVPTLAFNPFTVITGAVVGVIAGGYYAVMFEEVWPSMNV